MANPEIKAVIYSIICLCENRKRNRIEKTFNSFRHVYSMLFLQINFISNLKIELSTAASIIQPIELELFEEKQIKLFIKRDDLIHPFISGNKWRKLKYVLYDARLKGKQMLATFGGSYSNHLLAVACAGATFGFKTTGFVRGEELEIKNPVLKMCHLFGMRLIFIARNDYREKELFYTKYFGDNNDIYYVPEGGSCLEALPGVAELIDELPVTYDHIFTASGTGGTLAGLAQGVANGKLNESTRYRCNKRWRISQSGNTKMDW